MTLPRETSRRLLDLLHVGNRFKLMFGHPLNPTDPDVILFQAALNELKTITTMQATTPPITHASVKVMRSHDYCHFEVSLGYDAPATLEQIDTLRKEAARLADKAVAQYQAAKKAASLRSEMAEKWRLESALKTPESDRSPEEKGIIKYHQDAAFRARFNYDYEDDWHWPDQDDEQV